MADFSALWLSIQLAAATTIALFVVGIPLAWALSQSKSPLKPFIEAIVALPLVLPPTVIGFYLLLFLNPSAPLGGFWVNLTGDALVFSFEGLVIASMAYSLPFMVQPLQSAFEALGRGPMEAAASLRAGPVDAFFNVAVPLSARGFLTAGVLTFAHTIGEFGVVLMVGGAIPGETKVISIAIYEHVEAIEYAEAHTLSLILLGFSFTVLAGVYALNRKFRVHVG